MLPIVTEIKAPADPEALYLTLTSGRANSFLLESALLHSRLGRYSFLGGDPFLVLKTRGHQALLYRPGGVTKTITGNPWDIIRSLLARYRLPRQEQPIPFTGGAVGCLAYDLGRYIEKIPAWAADDLPFPEGYLAFYDTIVAIDHQEEKVYLVANGFPDTGPAAEKKALARIKELAPRLEGTRSPEPPAGLDGEKPPVTSLFTREAYCRAAARAREYIAAGDIFEVNLSQRLQAPLAMEPWELYRRLRRVNPAPFAAYLPLKEGAIASASPERFLRVSQGKVETRPIKGTRRRGNSPEEDQALRQELWQSAKDRAELVMIIDLERNDLGRVCQAGSVQVPELFVLEEYATVFHLVSTVTGVLEPGRDMVDL